MKRNLLSIIILALLIVNIVLTSIMMFSVTGAARQTSALVGDIASAIKLEMDVNTGGDSYGGGAAPDVPVENIVEYKMEAAMTIPLKIGEDGENHYCVIQPVFYMNSKSKDYSKYGEIASKEGIIQGIINDLVGSYTYEEINGEQEILKTDILKGVQTLYDSDFIFNVSFADIKWQ